MSIIAEPLNSVLVAVYQSGSTPAGSPVTRQKSLSYVRADASEEALYDVAQALFSLSLQPLLDVQLRKNFRLTEE
ncbi:DUF1659 domain-containing protein [Desulfosporosinus sp. BICA1-9]|uniref:DUF1659 domain-containing protein n=1 Tax=Desulfosporosinus sp. BICA1-9 TaxID=1531958 RepID=UPI00054B2F93|nr:DUF1659 domain-containing protein [Desulfosporosinus sp. BICA1-9]KJS86443.1 MAG: hypothetical protein JL57_16435 [Desulfosporosinus sp. BICA1-9]HBW36861.1 DUF1659 domain-containing protein [Desulfosporosinus sp.]